MTQADADRNLLFGLLALQVGLIDQGQLVAAYQAWALRKDLALADHLLARGDIDAGDRATIDSLVERHLRKHHGEIATSLAAAPATVSIQQAAAIIPVASPHGLVLLALALAAAGAALARRGV